MMIRTLPARIGCYARRRWSAAWRHSRALLLGVRFLPPNYVFRNRLGAMSVVVDVGCGFDADMSVQMIQRYGLMSFVVDPTLKHAAPLAELVKCFPSKMVHVPVAVGTTDGMLEFNESRENVSGSLLKSHTNIGHDTVRTYQVRCLTVPRLLE